MTNAPKIPQYPAHRGPIAAKQLRDRQQQSAYAASLIDDELRRLEDVAVEKFAVEDQRTSAINRLHELAEKNRAKRGRR